jgi:hypothetical protein
MTVRIPIITVFDSKGLKQAQYQLNKVRGNFQNLGRNFAIAGAAFAGAAAVIVKSARDLARIEKINAQTEAVLKSMGNSAGVTSKHIQDLAGNLERLTASEAETIQEGANLLLTFRNIQNQVGANNDIFDQAVKMSVDLSRAMGTTASGEAIRLGKALNDPVKGVSALTRVGVSFTEQQKEQIKTLQQSGDILGAQKIILAELQAQFGGSGQAYAATFAGQVELLNHELGALGEEATLAVMPALRDMITAFRELAPEIGAKMASAIKSVDWKAFTKTIVDLITFLSQNAETIMKVVTALYVLNTAYNVVKVTTGLYNAAAVILGNTFVVTAGKIGLATGAVKLFRTALITTGIGALVVGLGFVIEAIINTNNAAKDGTPKVGGYADVIRKSGQDADWAAQKYGTAKTAIEGLNSAASNYRPPNLSGVIASEARRDAAMAARGAASSGGVLPSLIPPSSTGGGATARQDPTGLQAWTASNEKEARVAGKEVKLIALGLSKDVAASLVGSNTPIKTANAAIQRINKNGTKAIANLTKSFQNSAAGQQAAASAAASAAAEAASAMAAAAAAAAQAAAEQAAREAAILAEKQRVYESFANSITSTFARIQESILGAFSLPSLGGSTDSIIRNMDKLLTRVKAFSANITKLSSMGLDPKLLQQVINAGPIAGAKLAANLVSGGVGGLTAINKGYAELGGLASEIGMTGTQAAFNNQAQQTIYNVNINGGLDSGATIGKAVVDAVRAYERTSGPVWQGA